MTKVDVEQTDLTLPELARLARKELVVLTRNGKPMASVQRLSDADWECIALANNPKFMAMIEESRRSLREEGGIPIEDVARELGLTLPKRRRRRPARPKKAKTGRPKSGNGNKQ
jgi:hypothetical protein